MDFATEAKYDVLTVNGMRYSGVSGDSFTEPALAVGDVFVLWTDIVWESDYRDSNIGWKLCVDPLPSCFDGLSLHPAPVADCPRDGEVSLMDCQTAEPGALCLGGKDCGTRGDINNCYDSLLTHPPTLDVYRKGNGTTRTTTGTTLTTQTSITHTSSTRTFTTQPAPAYLEVWSVSGPCAVIAGCVQSPHFPDQYSDRESCTVSLPRPHTFHVSVFATESYDKLQLDGVPYSGRELAAGDSLYVQSSIQWTSDASIVDAGWRLCLAGAATDMTVRDPGLSTAWVICLTVLSTAVLLVPVVLCIARARKGQKALPKEAVEVEAIEATTGTAGSTPAGEKDAVSVSREDLDNAMRAVIAAAAFNALDVNGDGTISRMEFAQHCAAKGVAPATATAAFATLDLDADGVITQQEFAAHVLQSGLAHPHVECQGTWVMDLPSGSRAIATVVGAQVSCAGQGFVLQGDEDSTFFHWQDGTRQQLTVTDRDGLVWTKGGRWPQALRWTRVPSCPMAPDCVNMELKISEGDECSKCGKEPRAGSWVWMCPSHDTCLCPQCAPVPREAVLGISAAWVIDRFPEMARSATGMANPNFHEICPAVAMGPRGLGFGKTCPRDGRPGCSVVDAVEEEHRGRATHFVSWCWAYSLNDFVSALQSWVVTEDVHAGDVYLWVCFFCNNQYRMLESGTRTGSDELKAVFETHLGATGRMLLMLDSFVQPKYISRAWCIFESFVCIDKKFAMSIILPESSGAKFKQTLDSAGGFSKLQEAFEAMDVRYAEASSKADEDMIKKLILTSSGFDVVNGAVKTRLLKWLTDVFRKHLLSQPAK
ncbi:Caln1 [Symbiodinium sp. CCMP2592]|nr:Caln1 [Symbiodinium sp. CCMP2592]